MDTHATPPSPRTQVRRHPERASYAADAVDAILNAALIAHVGYVDAGLPVVVPFASFYKAPVLYLHGSVAAGTLEKILGSRICVSVAMIDGLVLARSGFNSSMNYRSVVAFGRAREVETDDEKRTVLHEFVERMAPGRTSIVRGSTEAELRATRLVAVTIEEASAKTRTGQTKEPASDADPAIWAGVIPLVLTPQDPQPDAVTSPHTAPPALDGASWLDRPE